VSRVIQRTAQVMNELKTDDVAKMRAAGVPSTCRPSSAT
jgi:benzoyl-CoA 2,3-dioxygenase component B